MYIFRTNANTTSPSLAPPYSLNPSQFMMLVLNAFPASFFGGKVSCFVLFFLKSLTYCGIFYLKES